MTTAIDDFFLPKYIEAALKAAGKFQVSEFPWGEGLLLRHLELDREALRIIARGLRQRREELLSGVDLADRRGLAKRLAGLNDLLAEVGRADAPLRRESLQILPRISGFSPEMIDILLRQLAGLATGQGGPMADGVLPSNAAASTFVRTDAGYARYFAGPAGLSWPGLLAASRRHRHSPVPALPVTGMPRVVSNVAAGNVPGISVMEALTTILVGAASLGKNASAEPYFGPRFMQELAAREAEQGCFPLSDLMSLVTFPRTETGLLEELVHQGDHLQVTGGIDSKRDVGRIVRRLRPRSPRDLKRRVSGHWHKVSFDVIAREYLQGSWLDTAAGNVAFDNSMFETQGCLSAQQVFVEGEIEQVRGFARQYVTHMQRLLQQLPKGARPQERLREMYQWYEDKTGITIFTFLRDMPASPFFVALDEAPQTFAVHNALNRSILIRRLGCLRRTCPASWVPGKTRIFCSRAGWPSPRRGCCRSPRSWGGPA